MTDYFIRLFHYNDWANARQMAILPQIGNSGSRALAIMTHIVQVQRLWLLRINGSTERPTVWDPLPVAELIRLSSDSTTDWIRYLGSCTEEDLDRLVSYHNFQGSPFQNSVRDISAQTLSHSTHHRGQVNLLIRDAGLEPPLIDYIAFARHEFA